MSEFLSPQQVAERWACSEAHVQRLCGRQLPAMKSGRIWRIRLADVEAYEARHTTSAESVQPTAPKATGRGGTRPAAELDGGYLAVVPGPVPWRSTVITDAASPAARRGGSASKKKAALRGN